MDDTLNVLVLMDFSDASIDRFKTISPRLKFTKKVVKSANEISPEVWANTDILYTTGILPERDAAPKLAWVQSNSSGIDTFLAHPLFSSHDIILTTTAGIHAAPIAEYTFAMMLALARKIPLMLRNQQSAEWPIDRYTQYMPHELRGSTVGILGYGAIGREIARLAHAFGMEVLATKRNVMTPAAVNRFSEEGLGDTEAALVERLYPPEATRSMVSLCDFVVVLVPLTPTTKGVISAHVLSAMKPTAYLISLSRGAVIDEEALIKALQSDQIAGAALDVFIQEPLPASSPLWKLDNVIISPHIAGNNLHYNDSAAEVFAQNLERYINKKDLLNQVNFDQGY